ncbi:hypothetical protein PHMEG_00018339 [Phytophthora megakarya]|uniref:Uncharacterized protein n=1 Tax=Phytophthora megakarya TaxID=4795 RepID=A0A225VV42_9STRA|nr:hypothetical protein PHMEG_00018339 [Phytophthora megakarya]
MKAISWWDARPVHFRSSGGSTEIDRERLQDGAEEVELPSPRVITDSQRITKAMQVIEMETPHGTVKVKSCPSVHLGSGKRALRIFSDHMLSIEQVHLAVQMMGDNDVVHHEFPENKLCDMQGIGVADSEEEDDPKDEDYNSQEGEAETVADDDKEGSSSGWDAVLFSRRDSKKASFLRPIRRQTPGFADYVPQMNEVIYLKLRWTPLFVMKTQAEKAEDADDKEMEIYVGSLVIGHSLGAFLPHETVGRGFEKRLDRMFEKAVPRTII